MKLLVTGPMTSQGMGSVTRSVLSFLETSGIDCYALPKPISTKPNSPLLEFPVSAFIASIMTKALTAPFDALLSIHDTANISVDIETYNSCVHRIAYVGLSNRPDHAVNLDKRLRPFTYVISQNKRTADAIEHALGHRPGTASPEELVAMLIEIPGQPTDGTRPIVTSEVMQAKWDAIHELLTTPVRRFEDDGERYSLNDFRAYFEEHHGP